MAPILCSRVHYIASDVDETGIVERLRDELDIPVTHVVMQARSVV